jgi:predicted RNase H-like HicB family nuclease
MEKQRLEKISAKYRGLRLPLIIEKEEDGFYVVECPVLEGCYTQGKTIDEALQNIREVIEIALEEKENKEIIDDYQSKEFSIHTIAL